MPTHLVEYIKKIAWLILLAAPLYVGGTFFLDGRDAEFVVAIGSAFLIAAIFAVIVEPFAHARFAKNIASELLWFERSPFAPESHRAQVQAMMAQRTFYRSVSWTCTFEDDPELPDILELTIEVRTEAVSYEADGFQPSGERFVLASSDGRLSDYLKYAFSGDGIAIHLSHDDGRDIRNYVERHEDGSVVFNEVGAFNDLAEQRRVPSGQSFIIERSVRIYRHRRGFFPMINLSNVDRSSFFIKGSAASRLRFTHLNALTGKATELAGNRMIASSGLGAESMVILSWAPLN